MTEDAQSSEWANAFRQKSTYMKSWKPSNTPSNRDRLELYALHKQAVQGDAPSTLPSNANSGDRAKYHSWRSKNGIDKPEAMRLYCMEADRQVRVYGIINGGNNNNNNSSLAQSPTNGSLQSQQHNNNNNNTENTFNGNPQHQPRGLTAIPLLCAAASESRQAYLRRLAQTPVTHAWWKRQEPLTATPGTLFALPEQALISIASCVEYISLAIQQQDNNDDDTPLFLGVVPVAVLQSFLWPTHNSLLAIWIGLILVFTAWTAVYQLLHTLLLGSRRTGWSLPALWKDQVQFTAQSVHNLVEAHQPLSARLMGLWLLPLHMTVQLTGLLGPVWNAVAFCAILCASWWYWCLVLPTVWFWWMVLALVAAGQCFAVIELAGA